MSKLPSKEYMDFVRAVGHANFDGVGMTHDGYPLSVKEEKFVAMYIETGNLNKALREAKLSMRAVAGKDYLINEIKWRIESVQRETIADATEILQYFTSVMRNQERDQFGLEAPLAERTSAAKELARRIIDPELEKQKLLEQQNVAAPEIKVTLNFEGMDDASAE